MTLKGLFKEKTAQATFEVTLKGLFNEKTAQATFEVTLKGLIEEKTSEATSECKKTAESTSLQALGHEKTLEVTPGVTFQVFSAGEDKENSGFEIEFSKFGQVIQHMTQNQECSLTPA